MEQKKYVPKIIDVIVDSGMDAALIAIKGMAESKGLSEDQQSEAKKIVKTKMAEIKKVAKQVHCCECVSGQQVSPFFRDSSFPRPWTK